MMPSRREWVVLARWGLVYVLLAVAMTYPLAFRLRGTVAHDLGDPLLSTVLLWWNAHVLPLTERWWNGFAFYPVHGMMAFSDHRLGESLIASPLQWLGCSPATAYNLTVLATFPLCALAAHVLGFVLTRRHDAAAICGLAYGFNPYRMAHIEHLELLAAFGLPLALAALHQLETTVERRWTIGLSAALVLQGLCTSYYIAFFGVLLLWWIVWFVRWRNRWLLFDVGLAVTALAAALLPIALGYERIHRDFGLSHHIGEVTAFSADVTSLVTADPASMLWGWTSGLNSGEARVFPGLVITLLVAVGVGLAMRARQVRRDRTDRLAVALGAVALLFIAVAFSAKYLGPWRLTLGPIRLGADVFYKPFSVAVVALTAAAALTSRVRDAWTRRSVLAFYVTATVIIFLCSFGPRPTFLGSQVLYEPPYAWLMRLPVFSTSIRAPARFATLGVLTLAAAGALAFERLGLQGSRRLVAAVLMLGIAADGWSRAMPMPALPEALPVQQTSGFNAVLELPLGDEDQSAMFRSLTHGFPVVNGASGFLPPHYEALMAAVHERDTHVLDALGTLGHLLVAVNGNADRDHFWRSVLVSRAGAVNVSNSGNWSFFTLVPSDSQNLCESSSLPIVRVFDDRQSYDPQILLDRDPTTFWQQPTQREGASLVLELDRPSRVCGLLVSLGRAAYAYPRSLNVAASIDGVTWITAFEGSTSAHTVRAAIAQPTDEWLAFPLNPAIETARFVRLQLRQSRPDIPWQMSDIVVRGTTTPR